jgi:hypothetical protein
MRILQISDSHWGISSPKTLMKFFKKIHKDKMEFDLILHCGDYSGTKEGFKPTRATVRTIRELWPDKSYLTVLGNHDFYCASSNLNTKPSLFSFQENYSKITEMFKEYKVHFLDEDGIYINPAFPNIVFIGNSGWYNNWNPPTNDQYHLPYMVEGNTHRWLERKARKTLYNQLTEIDKFYDKDKHTICFVSHFPVVKEGDDWKGSFEEFSWDVNIGNLMQEDYNCKYFFEGHSHMYSHGPLKYNCGSDYYKPKYQIVEVK